MFSAQATPETFESPTFTGHLIWIVFDLARKLRHFLSFIVFKNLRFKNIFRPHENEKQYVKLILLEELFGKKCGFLDEL